MKLLQEFKAFAVKGNMLDMAVGIILGAAFGKVVSSLVKDVIMPPIGKMLGGVSFSNLFINLAPGMKAADGSAVTTLAQAQEAAVPVIAYGQFINNIVDFVVIAFSVFVVVKAFNTMKKKPVPEAPKPPPEPSKEEILLAEIRDAIKARH